MKKKRYITSRLSVLSPILFLTALLASTSLPLRAAPERGNQDETDEPRTGLTDIKISFKLDPRLTQSLYMGDRWVSPTSFTGSSGQETIEARAQGFLTGGRPVEITPKWVTSDAEMVGVEPERGSAVTINVKRAGRSRLRVSSNGLSKELILEAVSKNDLLQVEITQLAAERSAETEDSSVSSNTSPFASEKEKISYALGANVGTALRKQSVDVDHDLLIQGFQDAVSGGETLLTEDDVRIILLALESELKSRQLRAQVQRKQELAEKNDIEGKAFLAENRDREGVITLESGLQYKVLEQGDGDQPSAGDTVVCHYRGTLIDGTEFDTSNKNGRPASLALNRLIKGWSEALQLMPVGSKWRLFIPSNLAYGPRGIRGRIGPNATLIFEVELLSIQKDPRTRASHTPKEEIER